MINVIASITVNETCMDSFVKIFKSNIQNVLNEEGCVEYTPTIDFETKLPPQILDSNIVTIIEKWETIENLEAHLVAPHMLEYRSKVQDLVESVSLKVLKSV